MGAYESDFYNNPVVKACRDEYLSNKTIDMKTTNTFDGAVDEFAKKI
ncbi:hypothetical protein MgSA37_03813 [Mucilaginibacter gotjawali]|uniref:Uncharacterized protein n=2 Tax=Mucilaginibacter gotjawali TaxID=1550579 RepID=A0A839SN41_9SPHI|nr:hypothetical protein [Mucilaginibacter gotjawali]BAU55622.1 hypothetical protein MgSA37_03813 [Mucilaginibacter gotjawali]